MWLELKSHTYFQTNTLLKIGNTYSNIYVVRGDDKEVRLGFNWVPTDSKLWDLGGEGVELNNSYSESKNDYYIANVNISDVTALALNLINVRNKACKYPVLVI